MNNTDADRHADARFLLAEIGKLRGEQGNFLYMDELKGELILLASPLSVNGGENG